VSECHSLELEVRSVARRCRSCHLAAAESASHRRRRHLLENIKKNLNCLMLSYETLLIQLKLLNVIPFEKV
jgi:hypothetical protein